MQRLIFCLQRSIVTAWIFLRCLKTCPRLDQVRKLQSYFHLLTHSSASSIHTWRCTHFRRFHRSSAEFPASNRSDNPRSCWWQPPSFLQHVPGTCSTRSELQKRACRSLMIASYRRWHRGDRRIHTLVGLLSSKIPGSYGYSGSASDWF